MTKVHCRIDCIFREKKTMLCQREKIMIIKGNKCVEFKNIRDKSNEVYVWE